MKIIAIDPGTKQSAAVCLEDGRIDTAIILPNEEMLSRLRNQIEKTSTLLVIERVSSYGMAVGQEVFDTCYWGGNFQEAWEGNGGVVKFAFRKDIKVELCGSMKAKDANIRQVLIDIYGAPGTKKKPGQTYGMKADMWAALAVAEYARRQQKLMCREKVKK